MADTEQSSAQRTDAVTLRTPIVAVLGHVDHGKTTLLDTIRGSAVSEAEAGAITQHIGATAVPLETVAEIAGSLVDPGDFDLPGLLFIDTPGHHSFATLRSRGGALADIAIVVVDVNDGFQPQTIEALEILERTGTPFVIAANKVDMVPGWSSEAGGAIKPIYEAQSPRTRKQADERLYEIIGRLSDEGFSADLYWRVQNFTRNVGVVPLSAITSEGVPDLLAVLMGLSQRYMRGDMEINATGDGAGTILEIKDERGFGATIDAVLYDGRIATDDTIVVGGIDGPVVTSVRALLRPRPNAEIRLEKRFDRVDMVEAAAGVKIAGPELDAAVAGAPVRVVGDREVGEIIELVETELAEFAVTTEEYGVVVKADTLGSLEAMMAALEEAEVAAVRAEVGAIAPRDVTSASTVKTEQEQVILGFNVAVLPSAADLLETTDVRSFRSDVIYTLIEEYTAFTEEITATQQATVLDKIVRPCRFRILEDHIFRQSNPAVVGVEVLAGTLTNNRAVVRFDGAEPDRVGTLSGIQHQGEDVESVRAGAEVSVAIDGPTVGRQIDEGDELWVELPEAHAKVLELELADDIPGDELEALTQYVQRQRKREPFWAR